MTRLIPPIVVRSLAMALLFCAGSAATARGSCGDWLADHTARSDKVQPTTRDADAPPVDNPAPCHGPHCGKVPITPPAAPSAGVSVGEKSGLSLAGGLFGTPLLAPRFEHPQDDDRPTDDTSSSLLRPPRS